VSPVADQPPPLDIMERLEKYGYISVGVSFLILGMAVFVYGWAHFAQTVTDNLPRAVLVLLNDLLLVVILLELFRTILNFLKTHSITLEPFLQVGIIASLRKVLTLSAEMVLTGETSSTRFTQYLLDVGVHGGVVVALVLALYLYRTSQPDVPAPVSKS